MAEVNPNFLQAYKNDLDAENGRAFTSLGLLRQGDPAQLDAIYVAANREDPRAQRALGHIARFEVSEASQSLNQDFAKGASAEVTEDTYSDVAGMEDIWSLLDEITANHARIQGDYESARLLDDTEPNNDSSIVEFPETDAEEVARVTKWFKEHYPNGLPAVRIEPIQE